MKRYSVIANGDEERSAMNRDEHDRLAEIFWKARLEVQEMSTKGLRKVKKDSKAAYQAAMKQLAEADAELKRRLSPQEYQALKHKDAEREAEFLRLQAKAKMVAPKPDSTM